MVRVIFWGSPYYSIYALHNIYSAGFNIVGVYSREDNFSGRNARNKQPTPVAYEAERMAIPVYKPKNFIGESEFNRLITLKADCFVVAAYGKILPKKILDIPKLGCVNIHPSLLPMYRGATPVASAILDGVTYTGVTLSLMDTGIDSGPILAQSIPINIEQSFKQDVLLDKLMKIGAAMLPDVIRGLFNRNIKPIEQDHSLKSMTRRFTKSDGKINWNSSAMYIERMVRAFDPWPSTWTLLKGDVLKLLNVSIYSRECLASQKEVGSVFLQNGKMLVQCGRGILEIKSLQSAGRKPTTAKDFLNGNPYVLNAKLGD